MFANAMMMTSCLLVFLLCGVMLLMLWLPFKMMMVFAYVRDGFLLLLPSYLLIR